jgi:hypothetical protein
MACVANDSKRIVRTTYRLITAYDRVTKQLDKLRKEIDARMRSDFPGGKYFAVTDLGENNS